MFNGVSLWNIRVLQAYELSETDETESEASDEYDKLSYSDGTLYEGELQNGKKVESTLDSDAYK